MKTVDKTANLSQAKAKSMFKKYASNIVKILRSSGIKMIKESECHSGVDWICWDSCVTKDSYAKIHINIAYEKTNGKYIQWIDFVIKINYQNRDETDLEKKVRIKTENMTDKRYPLSNIRTSVVVENPKIPILKPEKEVAKQLYLALKCYNKINNSETKTRIEKMKKRISKLVEKETDVIAKSFFQ